MPNYALNNPYVLSSVDGHTLHLASLSDVMSTSACVEANAKEVYDQSVNIVCSDDPPTNPNLMYIPVEGSTITQYIHGEVNFGVAWNKSSMAYIFDSNGTDLLSGKFDRSDNQNIESREYWLSKNVATPLKYQVSTYFNTPVYNKYVDNVLEVFEPYSDGIIVPKPYVFNGGSAPADAGTTRYQFVSNAKLWIPEEHVTAYGGGLEYRQMFEKTNISAFAVEFELPSQSSWEHGEVKEFKFTGLLRTIKLNGRHSDVNGSLSTSSGWDTTSSDFKAGNVTILVEGSNKTTPSTVVCEKLVVDADIWNRVTVNNDKSSSTIVDYSIRCKVLKDTTRNANGFYLIGFEMNIPYFTENPYNEGVLRFSNVGIIAANYPCKLDEGLNTTRKPAFLPGGSSDDSNANSPLLPLDQFDKVTIGVNLNGVGRVSYACNALNSILDENVSEYRMYLEVNTIKKSP